MRRFSDVGTASTLSVRQPRIASLYGRHSRVGRREQDSRLHQSSHSSGNLSGSITGTLGIGGPVFYHKASIGSAARTGAATSRTFSPPRRESRLPLLRPKHVRRPEPVLLPAARDHGKHRSGHAVTPVYNGSGPAYFTPGAVYALASTADRENIANLHVGIPHKSGGLKDDIQFLFVNGEIFANFYSSINDIGGQQYFTKALGAPTYTDYNYYVGKV